MANTRSEGGPATLEMISIDKGYWRATNSSRDVLACYNADACLGGLTGTAEYCLEGYEGPCKFLVPRTHKIKLESAAFVCHKGVRLDGLRAETPVVAYCWLCMYA